MNGDKTILTVMFFQNDCWLMQSNDALTSTQTVGPLHYHFPAKAQHRHDYHLVGKGVTGPLSPQSTWKTVTIQLDTRQIVGSIDWWSCEKEWMPPSWHIDVSLDGIYYERALAVDQIQSNQSPGYLISAPCYRDNGDTGMLPLQTRFFRFAFDDTAENNNAYEWAVEICLRPLPKYQNLLSCFTKSPEQFFRGEKPTNKIVAPLVSNARV